MSKLRNDESLRSLYMAYTDDGILDMFAGFIILFAGLMLFTDMFWMAGVYVAIFLPVVWSVKEKVTMQRVRQEELNPAASRSMGKVLIGFLLAGLLALLLGFVVFFLFDKSELVSLEKEIILYGIAGLVGMAVLAGFILVGTIHRAPRWYIYAAVAAALAVIVWVLDIGLPWLLMAVGATMVVTGTGYLVRFLRGHPVLPEEERPAW